MQVDHAIGFIIRLMEREYPRNLPYHNLEHTLNVIRAVERFCQMECSDVKQTALVRTAAAFHDAGFIYTYQGHEFHSVRLAETILPEFGYSADDIARISGCIMDTEIGGVPRDRLSRVLCDADLDYLGRRDYLYVSSLLRKEWEDLGQDYSDRGWLEYQLEFLSLHRYNTPSARILRNPGKAENIRYIRQLLKAE